MRAEPNGIALRDLSYAREHWTRPDENPPVGLILCAEKDEAVALSTTALFFESAVSAEEELNNERFCDTRRDSAAIMSASATGGC